MATGAGAYPEPVIPWLSKSRLRLVAGLLLLSAVFSASRPLAQVDPAKLLSGLPRMASWTGKAWPPAMDELPVLLQRTGETIAMAAIGTTAAGLLALPLSVLAARNVTPSMAVYYPARWFLNALRGVDSFVFALLFVAAVGLGPFAGVLGIALHTWGSTAKLWAEAIENIPLGPLEGAAVTGASRLKVLAFALLPDVAPSMVSVGLFWWEFNVRASTVLGVVGAGGIGQELKNSMDLLLFPRLLTILVLFLGTRGDVALIFQQFNLIRRLTAIENVLVGRLPRVATWRVLVRRFARADRQLALRCLDTVGLLDRAYTRADQLSGGQQQRVAIARALAQDATVILADEPVASLDPESAATVLECLRAAVAAGVAVVASLHQVEFARAYADRIVALRAGRLVEDAPAAPIDERTLELIYSKNGGAQA